MVHSEEFEGGGATNAISPTYFVGEPNLNDPCLKSNRINVPLRQSLETTQGLGFNQQADFDFGTGLEFASGSSVATDVVEDHRDGSAKRFFSLHNASWFSSKPTQSAINPGADTKPEHLRRGSRRRFDSDYSIPDNPPNTAGFHLGWDRSE